MVRMFFSTLFICCMLSAVCPAPAQETAAAASREQLGKELDGIFNQEAFSNAFWGVRIETLDGEVLYDRNGAKGFVPASNMKMFTTSCAVEKLGPDYTYETVVKATGPIEDGVLKGDLVIVGSGDPSLGAWHPDDSNNAQKVFDEWIAALQESGIEKIEGDIIGDGRVFTKEYINEEWVYWDLPYWYAAGSSGLAIEENCFRTTIAPGEDVGDPARITINPQTAYVTVVNDVETVEAGGESNADIVWRKTEGNVFLYDRTVAIDDVIEERGSVWDGARYTAFLLRERLERDGIPVTGEAVNIRGLDNPARIDKAPRVAVIATTVSPPLSETLKVINRVSHNFFADMVLRTVGHEMENEGSFAAGASVVEDWLEEIGAPQPDGFNIVDGSGLAANNIIQPRQMTYLLRYMRNEAEHGEPFIESMSSAGESGWIKRRMKGTALEGKIRAKTGYIEYMRGLSGYAQTAGEEELVFSIFCNLYTVPLSQVDEATDAALEVVVEYVEGGEE